MSASTVLAVDLIDAEEPLRGFRATVTFGCVAGRSRDSHRPAPRRFSAVHCGALRGDV